MAITVTNTDAGLSGTTLLNGESAQTVTGLKTFDRDPSAPFAVSANSAVVTNLDADELDGQHGSYYTNASNLASGTVPTARLGSGSASSSTFLRGDGSWAAPTAYGKLLASDDTQAANSSTGETTLYTLTIPANTLDTNGNTIRFKAYGSLAANGNSKVVRVRWGGGSGTVAATYSQNTASLVFFEADVTITRLASNSQRIVGKVWYYATTSGAPQLLLTLTTDTKTDSGTIDLVLTGQGGATNDIIYEASTTEFLKVG